MKNTMSYWFVGALVSCCLSAQAAKNEITERFTGLAVQVEDGDTVAVLHPQKGLTVIRLTDIDAPEVRHGKSRPGQPFGTSAKRQMESLVLGKYVQADCYAETSRDRRVCRISAQGIDTGAALVRVGLAWVPDQRRYVRNDDMYGMVVQAKSAKVGLWSDRDAVPPWKWRKQCWVDKQCERSE